MAIEKVVSKTVPAAGEVADVEYWRRQSPLARLEAYTTLYNAWFGVTDEAPDRLPRVPAVAKRSLR